MEKAGLERKISFSASHSMGPMAKGQLPTASDMEGIPINAFPTSSATLFYLLRLAGEARKCQEEAAPEEPHRQAEASAVWLAP